VLAAVIFALGLASLLSFIWRASGLWFDQKDARRSRDQGLISRLAQVKPRSALTQVSTKDWLLITGVSLGTALFTRQPVLTVGSGVVLYMTRAFFGTDPMESRIKTMEENIAWMQTLTYLLQTSKSAWESLRISAKSLPDQVSKELLASLDQANTTLGGYVVRLRDALTLYAIRRADPQVDVIVAMVNANISSSGGSADYQVMQSIQEQLKAELAEQNAAVSARREIFTIAKIMFPAVVIMEAGLVVLMGAFIRPYYQTMEGNLVAGFVELITIGLLLLFRKFSAPMSETRLIVQKTFMDAMNRQINHAEAAPSQETEGSIS
jgi:hypothetical protein